VREDLGLIPGPGKHFNVCCLVCCCCVLHFDQTHIIWHLNFALHFVLKCSFIIILNILQNLCPIVRVSRCTREYKNWKLVDTIFVREGEVNKLTVFSDHMFCLPDANSWPVQLYLVYMYIVNVYLCYDIHSLSVKLFSVHFSLFVRMSIPCEKKVFSVPLCIIIKMSISCQSRQVHRSSSLLKHNQGYYVIIVSW